MSTTKEILEREASGEPLIYLHKEGAFWKAYQKSAFLVHKVEPSFKVKKQFVKVVDAEVVSLGFPEGALKRLFQAESIETLNEKLLRIKSAALLDESEYQAWFAGVALEQPKANSVGAAVSQNNLSMPLSGSEAWAIKQLREFRMEDATPIDCMTFLVTLRKELKQYGPL